MSKKRWSGKVTKESHALRLEPGVFKRSPEGIAHSLKRSSEASKDRKGSPYRSAMSMLNFYINRAGKNLSKATLTRLQLAKHELRRVFGKT